MTKKVDTRTYILRGYKPITIGDDKILHAGEENDLSWKFGGFENNIVMNKIKKANRDDTR